MGNYRIVGLIYRNTQLLIDDGNKRERPSVKSFCCSGLHQVRVLPRVHSGGRLPTNKPKQTTGFTPTGSREVHVGRNQHANKSTSDSCHSDYCKKCGIMDAASLSCYKKAVVDHSGIWIIRLYVHALDRLDECFTAVILYGSFFLFQRTFLNLFWLISIVKSHKYSWSGGFVCSLYLLTVRWLLVFMRPWALKCMAGGCCCLYNFSDRFQLIVKWPYSIPAIRLECNYTHSK